jgi:acyl-CoA hydrolase
MPTSSDKWRDASDAVSLIRSGMTVGLGHVGAEPLSLTAALWDRGPGLRDVTLLSGMMLSGYPFLKDELRDSFSLRTWFMPGSLLGPSGQVEAEYLPFDWVQTARFLTTGRIDVALVQVSEADGQGYHSLGISVGQHLPMLNGARLVIAEVNPNMPRTGGAALVHQSRLDVLVRADHPLIPFPHRPAGAADVAIANNVVDYIPDGATLQFGIGSIPGAVLDRLAEEARRDLVIHSQITDPARALIDAGCCRRELPAARVGEVLGSEELYRWADRNPLIDMVDAFGTHAPEALAQISDFVSVNSALEIDLYGQVNSETLDGQQVGAIGGSLDFAIGAQFPGNLSVIALRAQTRGGTSRIVPCLPAGPVTMQRSLVQVVATEYGAADLRGLSMGERAVALANVAAPDRRETLLRAAHEIGKGRRP